jgi:hypothetical protein
VSVASGGNAAISTKSSPLSGSTSAPDDEGDDEDDGRTDGVDGDVDDDGRNESPAVSGPDEVPVPGSRPLSSQTPRTTTSTSSSATALEVFGLDPSDGGGTRETTIGA